MTGSILNLTIRPELLQRRLILGHKRCGWIHHLAVAPASRRRGIATRLVRAAVSTLRDLGCPKVNLQIRASNADVVAFYQSLGFVIEERISMGRRLGGAD